MLHPGSLKRIGVGLFKFQLRHARFDVGAEAQVHGGLTILRTVT
jgi:hypothetical protein